MKNSSRFGREAVFTIAAGAAIVFGAMGIGQSFGTLLTPVRFAVVPVSQGLISGLGWRGAFLGLAVLI